jgi:arginase family enzyme
MKRAVLIMNFTGAYERESFAQNAAFRWLDCKGIQGTSCYCDETARRILQQKLVPFSPEGMHFIDSGNYHYVSKFWTDKIRRPFSLILFDHHPDMQPSLFSEMLSCGSWVKEALDTNPFLKKVCVLGAAESLLRNIDPAYSDRLACYSEQTLNHHESWKAFARLHLREPVYISVDKDVLNPQSAATNWDQGSLSITELESLLAIILRQEEVIGIDVCGECPSTLYSLDEREGDRLNDRANGELVRWIFSRPRIDA